MSSLEISSALHFTSLDFEDVTFCHPPTPPQREFSLMAPKKTLPSFFQPEDIKLMNLVKRGLIRDVEDHLIDKRPKFAFKWGLLQIEAMNLPNLRIFKRLWECQPLIGHECRYVILRKAAERDALDIVEYVLPWNYDHTPLFFNETWLSAAKHGSWKVLKFLLQNKKKNKIQISPEGWDLAISEAASRGNLSMLKLLHAKAGGFSIGQSERALQFACLQGHLEVVRFLLEINSLGIRVSRTLAVCKACQAKKLDPEILVELLKQPTLISRRTLGMLLKRVLKEGYVGIAQLILQSSSRLDLYDLYEAKELAERLEFRKIFDQVNLSPDGRKPSLIDAFKW